MLNQVLKVSSGTCQQFVEDAVKISKILRWKSLWCIHRELNFSYESTGERIFKIDPHLPKLLTNIKGHTFFETQCSRVMRKTKKNICKQ